METAGSIHSSGSLLLDQVVNGWWRRGEDERADYYAPAAFQSMDRFPQELETRRFETLAEFLRNHPPAFT